jgi:hypothetical protein
MKAKFKGTFETTFERQNFLGTPGEFGDAGGDHRHTKPNDRQGRPWLAKAKDGAMVQVPGE